MNNKEPKVLALYLPQFHTIPENDEWWGEGFTEWVTIKNAQKLFEGHNQKRVPLNNNYYDLMNPKTMEWQTALAKDHGIHGFVVYHYWFNGKKLLEKPMEQYLENDNIDFPYCFCWANEHWTNGWVSGESKILMEQNFNNPQDWIDHFQYLLPFFKDQRYLKEDNKPLFVIYLPNIIGPLEEIMTCWNQLAIENGFDGVEFIYQHYMYYLDKKADKSQFAYGIEFEPNLSINELKTPIQSFIEIAKIKLSIFLQTKLKIYIKLKQKEATHFNYDDLWEHSLNRKPISKKMIPGAFVDWDNTPRKAERGSVVDGASPEKFKKYFKRLIQKSKKEYESDKIILFAWNEWAEGGYLEPDTKNRYGYLQAIKEALEEEREDNE